MINKKDMSYFYIKKLLLASWIVLGVLIFFSALHEQVFISRDWQRKIVSLFPQGWSFFTKSPREKSLYVYRIQPNGTLYEMPVNNHQNPAFGLSRTSRLIGYEASMIANKVGSSGWNEYRGRALSEFLTDSVLVVSGEPDFNHMVPGDYILKLMEPIPFAWADKGQEKNNPFLISRIRIQ